MRILLIITILFIHTGGYTQQDVIHIDSWVKRVEDTHPKPGQWLFVDFWATWCAPCIYSMDYVKHQLKPASGDRVLYVNLSNQPFFTVRQFINRKDLSGNFALDYKGKIFADYQVSALPYAILLDPRGKLRWQGHPSDLKAGDLQKLLKKGPNSGQLVIEIHPDAHSQEDDVMSSPPKPAEQEIVHVPQHSFTLNKLSAPAPFEIYKENSVDIRIRGQLTRILAQILRCQLNQIASGMDDVYVEILFKGSEELLYSKKFKDDLLDRLHARIEVQTIFTDYYAIKTLDESLLWPNNRINWGKDTPNIMIGSSDLTANDMSLHEFAQALGDVLGKIVQVDGDIEGTFDWQVHTAYESLMIDQLKDEYGIDMEMKNGPVMVFQVLPLNP